MTTVGGQKFTTFAKNAAWDSDLFEDLVAPKLDNGLLAETWMNGVNPLPSYCTPEYKVGGSLVGLGASVCRCVWQCRN